MIDSPEKYFLKAQEIKERAREIKEILRNIPNSKVDWEPRYNSAMRVIILREREKSRYSNFIPATLIKTLEYFVAYDGDDINNYDKVFIRVIGGNGKVIPLSSIWERLTKEQRKYLAFHLDLFR